MQQYYLYIMNKECFSKYYHKSYVLYDFLKEYKRLHHNKLYQRQFHFITQPVPTEKIYQYLVMNSNLTIKKNRNGFLLEDGNIRIKIERKRKEWMIDANCIHELEMFLFDYLRELDYPFFVVNFTESQYGWLSLRQKEFAL